MLSRFAQKFRFHYAWIILISCCILQLGMQGVFNYCSGAFYVSVSESLEIGVGAFSVSTALHGIALGLFSPIGGRIYSKKHMGKQMAAVTAAMCFLFASLSRATAVWNWYLVMTILGAIGSMILILPVPILINNWFDKNAGTVLAIASSFSGISGAIVAPLAAKIIAGEGWQKAYLILGAAAAAVTIPVLLLLVVYSPEQMGLAPYGQETARENTPEEECADREKAGDSWGKAALMLITIVVLCLYNGFYSHISSFATSMGMDAIYGAKLMSLVMIGTVLMRLLLGILNDRFGVFRTSQIALLIAACCLTAFIFFGRNPQVLRVAAVGLGVGPAVLGVIPPMLTRTLYGRKGYAKMFPLAMLAAAMASSLGNMGIGLLYDWLGSYVPAFAIGIVLSGIGMILVNSVLEKRVNKKDKETGAMS